MWLDSSQEPRRLGWRTRSSIRLPSTSSGATFRSGSERPRRSSARRAACACAPLIGSRSRRGHSVSASSQRSRRRGRASLGKQFLPPAEGGGAQHPAGQAQIQPTQENGGFGLARRQPRRRWPPRRGIRYPRPTDGDVLPIRHAPACPRPPALKCGLDRQRGRGHGRRGWIQEGMDPLAMQAATASRVMGTNAAERVAQPSTQRSRPCALAA